MADTSSNTPDTPDTSVDAGGTDPVDTPAPQSEHDSVVELLNSIREEQAQHRAEVASLREELAQAQRQASTPSPPAAANPQSPEELLAARMDTIAGKDFYCPGCGALYDYRQRCTGRAESPHPPIEVVSTDELKAGDESKHTAPVYAEQ